jgi:hypothetical protein
MRAYCRSLIRLQAPISLADLARKLATGQNFLLESCDGTSLAQIELVAAPYGYRATVRGSDAVELRFQGKARRSGWSMTALRSVGRAVNTRWRHTLLAALL